MIDIEKNEYITFCKCGCKNGVVLKAYNDDHELSLQFVSDNFYLMQNKGKMSLKEKLKRIWFIIRGKEYCYFDILIDERELPRFKEFVARLQEESNMRQYDSKK